MEEKNKKPFDPQKREVRSCGIDISIREADGGGESRIVEGTAIVFNAESNVLDDWGVEFREVIKPEAVTQTWINSQDVKLNLMHNRQDTIGRSRMGKGNMQITVDGKGVNFRCEVPKCDIGDRALELIRSGVITGCSFEFRTKDYEIEERGANREVRITHKAFESISAFTLAMDPAYSQTSCNAREAWDFTPTAIREQQEAEQKKQREAEQERERQEKERLLMRERERSESRRLARERELELMEY